jgi:hypothetical protein
MDLETPAPNGPCECFAKAEGLRLGSLAGRHPQLPFPVPRAAKTDIENSISTRFMARLLIVWARANDPPPAHRRTCPPWCNALRPELESPSRQPGVRRCRDSVALHGAHANKPGEFAVRPLSGDFYRLEVPEPPFWKPDLVAQLPPSWVMCRVSVAGAADGGNLHSPPSGHVVAVSSPPPTANAE